MHMKKNFLLLGLLAFVAFFISSCSQEDVVNDTKGASPESIKVEKMTNLFKTYNWNLDTTIPEKERNKLILQMDYDKVKEFLENLNKGIKFEKKDTLVGEVKAKASKTRGITEHHYSITGTHYNALTQSNTISRIDMTYTPPRTPKVTITGSSISANYGGMTWTPDESNPKDFYFSGNRCNISLNGIIRYKPFYSGKQIMAGYVTKNRSGYLDGGKVERLH
jgi:hypothetical protein